MVDLLKAAEALRRQRLGQQKPKSLLAAAEQTRALMGSNLPQPAPQQPQQAPQNQGSVLGDIGHGLAAGTANLAGAIGDIPNLLTAGAVPPLSPSLSAFSEQQRAQYRPETQQAMQNIQQAEGFGGTLSAIAQNPVGAAQYVVESAPSFVPGVAAVTGASRLAKGAALAKGLTQQAAQQAAVRAGTRAAVGTNATLSGAFAGQQAAQGVREMPQDQLEALPDYQALLAEGIAPDAAREALANRAGRYAGAVGAPLGAATGMIGAPIEARLASGQAATLGGALSRIGATAGSQTLEEGLQEGSEQFAANVGQRQVDPAQALTEGVPESIALGGTLGAVAGGGLSAAGEVARLRQPQDTPQPEQAPTAPQPEQPTLSLPSPGRQRMDRVGQVIMPDGSTTNSPADVEDFVADFVQNVAPDAQEATAMDLRNAIYGGFFEKNGLDKFIERGQKTRRATYLNQPERPPIAGKGAVFEQGQRERTTQPQQVRRPADIEGEFYQDANVGGRGFEQQTTPPPKRQQQRKLTTEKRNALAEQVLAGEVLPSTNAENIHGIFDALDSFEPRIIDKAPDQLTQQAKSLTARATKLLAKETLNDNQRKRVEADIARALLIRDKLQTRGQEAPLALPAPEEAAAKGVDLAAIERAVFARRNPDGQLGIEGPDRVTESAESSAIQPTRQPAGATNDADNDSATVADQPAPQRQSGESRGRTGGDVGRNAGEAGQLDEFNSDVKALQETGNQTTFRKKYGADVNRIVLRKIQNGEDVEFPDVMAEADAEKQAREERRKEYFSPENQAKLEAEAKAKAEASQAEEDRVSADIYQRAKSHFDALKDGDTFGLPGEEGAFTVSKSGDSLIITRSDGEVVGGVRGGKMDSGARSFAVGFIEGDYEVNSVNDGDIIAPDGQLTDDQIAARTKPVGEEGDANTLRWHASEDAANRYAKVRGYGEYHVRKINGQYVAVPDTVSKPLTAAPTATQEKANEVQKGQEKAGPVETPQEQAAVHIEGDEQETVTPAVVADAVEKGADKVDRPTPEIRKQLVADIEHRLRLAQEEAKLDGNAEGLLKPTEISSAEYDFVTFNVPGDGKFKVKNKPENLEKFLKQVKRTPAFAGEPPKTPSSGLRLGPIAETIKEFSESSDPDDIKNAIELLRLQGKKSETSPLIEKLRNLGVDAGYDVTPADEYTPKYPSATKLGISNSSNRLWFPVRVKGKVVWGTGHMIDVTPPPTKKKIETIPYDRAAPIARDSLAEFFENGPDNLKDADYTIPPYNKTKDKAVFVGSIGEYAISVARNQLYYYDEAYYGYFAKKYPNAALYITKDEGRLIFEDGGDFVGVLAGIYEDRVDAGIKEAAKSLLDTPKPAQKEVEARKQDRRKDTAKRKRVNEMSPEEMRRELLIDPLTGLGNRRAFEEMLEDSPPAYLASIDADSLKWINDNMSPNTGDALLKAVGDALKTVDADNAYHISGDEYYLTGESEAALQAALDKVDAALADVTLEIEKPTEIIKLKGLRITYGFGQDKETADTALKQAKRDREQAGERASRGETPKGVQRQPKGVSEPTATGGQAEGEVTPKADESAAPAEETNPRPASPGIVEHGESAPAPGKLPEQDSVIAGSVRLSDAIHKWMYDKANRGKKMSWRVFQRLANEAYGGKQSDGAWDIRQAYDAMELFFNKDVVGGKKGGASNSTPSQVKVQIGMYEDVQSRLPTQTRRSEEQQALHQFSTPHTHSHAVAWVAGIKPDDIVLEPSAGTGNLAAHAWQFGPDKIYANELSEYRATMLKQLKKLDAVMTENAQHIHAVFPKNLDKPTVIVMNPPFSANALKKGSKDLEEGARHVESALKLLADNGRLVAILGRGMALDKPRMKKVWARIKKDYNVRAVIGIDGEAYRKFGTSFDNVIAVIDKTGPTTDKPLTGDVKKVDELIPLLQGIHDDRAPLPDSRRQQSEDQPSRAQSAAPSKGKTKSGKSLRGAVDAVGVTQQQVPGPQEDGAGATGGAGGAGSATRASDGESVAGRAGQGDGASTDSSDKPGGAGKRSAGATRKQDKRSGSVVSSPLDQPGTVSFKSNKGTSKAVGQSTFDSYVPAYSFSFAQDHPAILAESAAMASVQPPKLEYQPNLPEAVIADGRLSNAQLQTIAYAGQAHSKMLPGGKFRRGYFIGDGTGVGKGAQIAGIILDNWRQGRRKAVWVSENEGLRPDAKRDAEWAGLGGKNIIKAPAGSEDINNEQGILFTTYSTLKNASHEIKDANGNIIKPSVTRLDQIVNWLGEDFDGVIAFDESHNMSNAMDFKGKRGVAKASITALAGIDLQQRLPNARVVYVSATGATEVRNLAYAERLGLWGEGTPFGNKQEFVSEIESGGVAAMEVVAKDLKSMGIYQARSISFEGVEYDTVQQVMTPEQKQIYNKIADTWQIILQNVDEAMEDSGSDKDGRARSAALSAFWGNQQRFFNQLITAMQVPALIKSIEAELENGNSAVLQLVNTDEALMKRRIAQAEDAGMDLDDVDFTPRDIMMQYLAKSFPTTMYEEYTDENGNQRTRPVLNSAGDPVENPKAVEMRDKLLEDLGGLDVPDGALNQLLSYFGKDAVAEITGRSTRVIRDENGKVVLEKFTQAMKARDEKAFQDGKKRILVFSDAGGTGRSYHASNTFKNQQKRIHYLVQPGWRADKAVQGFGRTHRTNQASPPEYRLVTTDLVAQARFLSSIARRLDQLGALTKGQRDTANQGLFDAEANLENEYGESALEVFIDDLYHDRMPEVGARDEIAKQLGFRLFDDDGNSRDLKVSVPQFLNRTLSLRTDMMEKVFGKFMDNLRSIIQYAKENNMYDTGMQIFSSDGVNVLSITKDHEDVVRDKGDGVTKYIRFLVEKPTQLKAWADIPETAKFYRNNRSQILYAVYDDGRATDPKTGRILTRVAISTPIKTRSRLGDIGLITYREFPSDRASEVDRGDAKKLWEQAYKSAPKTVTENYHMITGALLPIWDRLPRGDLNEVLRVTDDSGERVVGRRIKEKDLNRTLKNLGIAQDVPKLSPKEWADRLLNEGSTLVLANNWKLKRARVAGEYRIEIVGPTNNDYNTLKEQGAFTEIIQYKTRVFVPAKNTSEILGRIIDSKPVVEVEGQAKYSQAQTTGTTTAAVREALNLTPKAKKALLDSQRVRIVQSVSEIPGSHPDDVAGAYHEGAIWLVADNLTRQDAYEVLLHEVVHAELSKSPEFQRLLDEVEAGVKRGGRPFVAARNAVPEGTPAKYIKEETLAYLVQNNARLPIVKRLIALIRKVLRRYGLVERYTASDIVLMAEGALRRMAGGERVTRINDVLYHRAFHGSPHDFDKFGLHAMGTGEGHQAYGWGLYFTDRKEIGEWYKTQLSQDGKGHNYEVEIDAALDEYLDWDKPLAEQSEYVKERLLDRGVVAGDMLADEREDGRFVIKVSQLGGPYKLLDKRSYATEEEAYEAIEYINDLAMRSLTGERLYKQISEAKHLPRMSGPEANKAASEYLNAIGIPGIRFLDGVSRSSGDGSYNYVVFDDSLIEIKAKYSRRATNDLSKAGKASVADAVKAYTEPVRDKARPITDKVQAWINKASPLGGLPDQAKYLKRRYLTLGKIADIDTNAKALYGAFRNVSEEDAKNVYDYLTTKNAKPEIIKDEAARAAAVDAKKTIIEVGQKLVDRGLLDQATYEANKGAYLPRIYLKHLLDENSFVALGTGKKPSDLGYLKRRKDIPESVRRLVLGEITDPGYLTAKGYGTQMRDIALLDWLAEISKNDEWVIPKQLIEWQGQNVTPFWLKSEAARIREQSRYYTADDRAQALVLAQKMDDAAGDALESYDDVPKGYMQIPKTPRYGHLRGLIVRKEIYDDIVGSTNIMMGDISVAERILGNGGVATKMTQLFKMSKVALNPPAQIRNFVSNAVLMHLSGVPFHLVGKRMIDAIRDIRANGQYYQIAKKYGVTESTFSAQELFRMERELLDLEARRAGPISFATVKNFAGKVGDKASDIYQMSEAIFKTAKIIDAMKREKMSEGDAALEAQKWLFDYSLVTPSMRYLRNAPVGVPFITFYFKALPRLIEVATKHPLRLAPYLAIPFAMTAIIASMEDVDDDDVKALQKALPKWLQERGHAYFLPVRDENGRWQAMDMGYFFPWTTWTELASELGEGEFGKAMMTSGLLGGPLPDMIAAVKTNTDPFTGKQIVNEYDPPAKKMAAVMGYLYTLGAPTWLTNYGFAGHMYRAINGTVDKYGEPKTSEGQALLRLLGVNVYPIEPMRTRAENIKRMRFEISQVKRRATQLMKDRNLSPAGRREIRDEYNDIIKQRMAALRQYAKESRIHPNLR